jgi:hypothetical protein
LLYLLLRGDRRRLPLPTPVLSCHPRSVGPRMIFCSMSGALSLCNVIHNDVLSACLVSLRPRIFLRARSLRAALRNSALAILAALLLGGAAVLGVSSLRYLHDDVRVGVRRGVGVGRHVAVKAVVAHVVLRKASLVGGVVTVPHRGGMNETPILPALPRRQPWVSALGDADEGLSARRRGHPWALLGQVEGSPRGPCPAAAAIFYGHAVSLSHT